MQLRQLPSKKSVCWHFWLNSSVYIFNNNVAAEITGLDAIIQKIQLQQQNSRDTLAQITRNYTLSHHAPIKILPPFFPIVPVQRSI